MFLLRSVSVGQILNETVGEYKRRKNSIGDLGAVDRFLDFGSPRFETERTSFSFREGEKKIVVYINATRAFLKKKSARNFVEIYRGKFNHNKIRVNIISSQHF